MNVEMIAVDMSNAAEYQAAVERLALSIVQRASDTKTPINEVLACSIIYTITALRLADQSLDRATASVKMFLDGAMCIMRHQAMKAQN